MRVNRHIIPLLLLLLLPCRTPASAQGKFKIETPLRPVHSAYMFEAGSSHLLDTYLSPIHYTGFHLALDYERTQAMKFDPVWWQQQLLLGIEFDRGKNVSGNATMLYGNLHASWGMNRIWALPYGLTAATGGMVRADIGGMYASRNGNNPASALADATLGLNGSLGWKTKLGRLPVTLRWQSQLPLAGCFFSPEYDELYYEIYLGNHSGLAHFAWPGNFFRWENLVTADLAVGTSSLRVGFRSRIYSTEVNHITVRNFSYAFVIGVTTDWLSISRRKPLKSIENIQWVY